MKNLFLLVITGIAVLCKAQVPLNTRLNDINNCTYVFDANNELDPFVGEYKAIYQGRETTLFVSKVIPSYAKSPDFTFF